MTKIGGDPMNDALAGIVKNTIRASLQNQAPDDYTGDDGLLMCGKCHTPKQMDQSIMGVVRRVGVVCQCQKVELQAEDAEAKRVRQRLNIHRMRREGLTDHGYYQCLFERDDRRYEKVSSACRKYVDDWEKMRSQNIGLLFYGDVGTGKSFYACCIANALLDKGVSALVTSFPKILAKIQSSKFGDELPWTLDMIERCGLVVIDDLGVERCTEYAMEQIFNVIDARSRSGKPLIITTNLPPSAFKNPDLGHQRIYDRILENSIKVKMVGESRRAESQAKKQAEYAKKLGLE